MLRLNKPVYSFKNVLDEIGQGIGKPDFAQKILDAENALLREEKQYLLHASHCELFKFLPLPADYKEGDEVLEKLSKAEFKKLYEDYFRDKDKPARKIYDNLLNASQHHCPFCGGIGVPRNLDHFLPKNNFPQFSVLPCNLIPSCRDCNMDGKGTQFARSATEQIIHPYLDDDVFFNEQWIFATYHAPDNPDDPGVVEYFALPPSSWSEVNQKRARKHFASFDLGNRYAIQASDQLPETLQQIKNLQKLALSAEQIGDTLFPEKSSANLFPNHWRKIMYQALAATL